MSFSVDIGFVSNQGGKALNEDFCAALLPEPGMEAMGAIAALCDGVSTGGRGKEAAQTTVMSLVRDYFGAPSTWDTSVALDRIIQAQNSWLYRQNLSRAPSLGMTTLTALVLRGQSYVLAHVGDSRAYLFRDHTLTQLSQDHVVPQLDMRHHLLRSLGNEERVAVDYQQGELCAGDVFVLLSDGVYGQFKPSQLEALSQKIVRSSAHAPFTAQHLAEQLVSAALDAKAQDNASALVVRISALPAPQLSDSISQFNALPALPAMKPGQVIDGLEVLELLQDNGVSLVYKVRERAVALGHSEPRVWVLKTLHRARASDRQERIILAHESWLAKKLALSRAAPFLAAPIEWPPSVALGGGEASLTKSGFYLLYEWLEGESFQEWMSRDTDLAGASKLSQLLDTAKQAVLGLGKLHQEGVTHRDMKPANLFRLKDGRVKILDLGVALSGADSQAAKLLHAGTPSYMNPEQWGFALSGEGTRQAPDAKSDLYALGVSLYQMLSLGRLPYGEVVPYQIGRFHKNAAPPSHHNKQVPIWLDAVVMKAIHRDQRQRFETAEEFFLALERGASRTSALTQHVPMMQGDPLMKWKIAFAVSFLLNFALMFWLLFLPRA